MEQNKENKISESYYPDVKDWAELRKYVAILKKDKKYICTGRDANDKSEVYKSDGSDIFYFYNFSESYTENGKLMLVFHEHKYNEYLVEAESCEFYLLNKPSLIETIENRIKQNLT